MIFKIMMIRDQVLFILIYILLIPINEKLPREVKSFITMSYSENDTDLRENTLIDETA